MAILEGSLIGCEIHLEGSLIGCERVADLLTAIKALRCDVKFEDFWLATLERCAKLGIEEPKEKRPRKVPRRLDENPDTAAQVSVKDKFKIFFFYNVSF